MTTRTETFLLFPEGKQLPFPPQCVFHFHAQAFLEIHFPCGVKRIGCSLKLDMSFDRCLRCSEESDRLKHSFSSDHDACKDPVAPFMDMEVLLLYPSSGFVVVPFSGPLPQHLEDGIIDILEGFLAHDVLVIACPPRMSGLSCKIRCPAVAPWFSLTTLRIFSKNVFTFFFDGLMMSFPL